MSNIRCDALHPGLTITGPQPYGCQLCLLSSAIEEVGDIARDLEDAKKEVEQLLARAAGTCKDIKELLKP